MITNAYDYINFEDKTQYLFVSDGQKGQIVKMVVFSPIKDDLWNLGFGDLQKGLIDGSVISNNYDVVRTISTVAKIAYEFSDEFPLRRIHIEPVDEKRKRLYNHVFRRHYDAIIADFQITGYVNEKEEIYSPKKNYDIFELKRRFVQ